MGKEKRALEAVKDSKKLTLGDIHLCIPPLEKLYNTNLPVKTAYWLSRAIDSLEREKKNIETQRVNLIKKIGDEQENGDFVVPPKKIEEFNKEFLELLSVEVPEFKFNPISIDLLETEGIKLTPVEINNLTKYGFIDG